MMIRKLPAAILALLFIATMALVPACSASPSQAPQPALTCPPWGDPSADWRSNTSPITLTAYADSPAFKEWSDPVTKRVAAKTGVTLKLTLPVQNEEFETVSLFMASNQFPDLLFLGGRNESILPLLFEKKLACLDDQMAQYAPHMRQMIGDEDGSEILTDFLAPDKKLYALFYGYETGKAQTDLAGYDLQIPMTLPANLVREDYFKEIGSPDTSTPEKFVAAFQQMKKNHPEKTGLISKPLIANFGMDFFGGWIINPDYSMTYELRDPRYKQMMEFYNKLYRDGILDKGSFIDSADVNWSKWLNGDVIGISGRFMDGYGGNGEGYTPIPAANTRMVALPPFEGYSWKSAYWANGVALIPASTGHKDRAILFLEYCASKEGQLDLLYGVNGPEGGKYVDPANGPHYYFDSKNPTALFPEGKPTLYPEVASLLETDPNFSLQSGLRRHFLMENWRLSYWPIPKLTAPEERSKQYKTMMQGKVQLGTDLMFYVDPLKDESVIQDKISLMKDEYEAKMIMAASKQEVDALCDELLQKATDSGLEKVEKEFTAAYARRRANTSLIPGS